MAAARTLLDVTEFDNDDYSYDELGQISFDSEGMLAVVTIKPSKLKQVEDFVKHINSSPGLHVDAAPASGSPMFANASRFVNRGDRDFLEAVKEYADKYRGWTLDEVSQ